MESSLKVATTYAWGKNKDGELSQGSSKDVLLPTPCKGIKNKNLIMVISGGQHSAAIDSTGKLYTCGSYLHGKLGIEDLTTVSVLSFTPVTALKDKVVRQVACGDYHTLCLLEDGSVYTWGGTLHKKLGQRGAGKNINHPGLVSAFNDKDVIYVDCGDFHSMALTADGKVYSWGGGGSFFNRGQCGHGNTNDVDNPQIIAGLQNKFITMISCGGYHTLAVTDNNEVYAWGSGLYGECGFGEFLNATSPKQVLMPWIKRNGDNQYGEIVQISGGGHHSLVLTSAGYVFSFGFASHGQLGLRNTVNQAEPRLVSDLRTKPVKMIAAGWNHSLVLTQRGDVFACGYGFFGQLGLGDDESKTIFTHVSTLGSKKVERIYAGGNHSWALLDPAEPIRADYEPPSPLPAEMSLLDISRVPSPPPSIQQRSGTPDSLNRSMRLEGSFQKPETLLQIAYSDIQYSHRFIRFMLKETSLEVGKAKAEEFVHEMYMSELGVLYHRIQEDDDIVEVTNSEPIVASAGGELSFTCLLVCDPTKNDPPVTIESYIGEPSQLTVFLKAQQMTSNPTQAALSEWVRFFLLKVGSFCSKPPKFFELRPISYYMNL
ncbi:unnamed protein product [Blepharisma stoltei]|uniref:RCC1-like domain-containing protein n=1 Tax=Blepharisma stoltei TaxID=1481888 RepID=A0AAU9JNA9_9CILI|nr:unnamed protein product [Blepharisma stoltei]